MDVGLVLSAVAMFAAVELAAALWPPRTLSEGPAWATVWALLVGVAVGRWVAMEIDEPGAIGELRSLTSIRGGVEFWPGLAAGLLMVAWRARRDCVAVMDRLADLAPYGLVAAAAYQVMCLVREGCYGPDVPFGFSPDGIGGPVLPVEPIGAGVLVAAAVMLLHRRDRWAPGLVAMVAIALLAVQRAVISMWLPVVGAGLSRQHKQSIAVAVIATAIVLWMGARRHTRAAVARALSDEAR